MVGTQADAMATIWDLAEGFAVLARTSAPTDATHAHRLYKIASRMRDRARAIEREELADHLDAACQTLALRSG